MLPVEGIKLPYTTNFKIHKIISKPHLHIWQYSSRIFKNQH